MICIRLEAQIIYPPLNGELNINNNKSSVFEVSLVTEV